MYMRFVQMKVEMHKMPEMQEFYRQVVIPSLHAVNGSIFASLIQSHDHQGEYISMTLWDNRSNADEYGKSSLYHDLIDKLKAYLADSTEWKIQLSKDLTLEAVPVVEELVVQSYSIEDFKDGAASDANEDRSQLYVRIVVLKVHQGRMDEFRKIYAGEVFPALQSMKGCRYAFLTERGNDNDEVLSVTIWNSEQDASAYETSGLTGQLVKKLSNTFSEFYQWKLDLEKDSGKKVITSEDIKVKHYEVVTGESFKGF
jgi:quinol monooxygenase YgiN